LLRQLPVSLRGTEEKRLEERRTGVAYRGLERERGDVARPAEISHVGPLPGRQTIKKRRAGDYTECGVRNKGAILSSVQVRPSSRYETFAGHWIEQG